MFNFSFKIDPCQTFQSKIPSYFSQCGDSIATCGGYHGDAMWLSWWPYVGGIRSAYVITSLYYSHKALIHCLYVVCVLYFVTEDLRLAQLKCYLFTFLTSLKLKYRKKKLCHYSSVSMFRREAFPHNQYVIIRGQGGG